MQSARPVRRLAELFSLGRLARMKKLSDQTLATRMLRAREDGGYKFVPFVRMNAKAYSFLGVYFGVLLVWLALAEAWPVFALVLGVLFGVLLRDMSWVIRVNRTWPFVIKVTDWEAVKRLSDEKPSV